MYHAAVLYCRCFSSFFTRYLWERVKEQVKYFLRRKYPLRGRLSDAPFRVPAGNGCERRREGHDSEREPDAGDSIVQPVGIVGELVIHQANKKTDTDLHGESDLHQQRKSVQPPSSSTYILQNLRGEHDGIPYPIEQGSLGQHVDLTVSRS